MNLHRRPLGGLRVGHELPPVSTTAVFAASAIVGVLMEPGGHSTVVTLRAYKIADTLERTIGAPQSGSADCLLLVDGAWPDGTVDVARRLSIDVRAPIG